MRQSAGLLLFRVRDSGVEVMLVHPGGPFWARRDEGAWTIPKGEFDANESPLAAARREFREETGTDVDVDGPFHALQPVRQAGGKHVHAFAVEADFDAATLASNTFELEWPPRSGRLQRFPEVDRAAWFTLAHAAAKLHPAQRPWLDEIATVVLPARNA
jgi:predicted NUDIX family NTP pyrophosphohydrolase